MQSHTPIIADQHHLFSSSGGFIAGIAKTTLGRLLVGLGGCAAVTAAWPFAHRGHNTLLLLVVILGLVAGIAFSASYQLVARFANKNTISLGLGCVGSGIVTLIMETALRMGSTPSHKQELILFEATAGKLHFCYLVNAF